jgi:hypothetical protein
MHDNPTRIRTAMHEYEAQHASFEEISPFTERDGNKKAIRWSDENATYTTDRLRTKPSLCPGATNDQLLDSEYLGRVILDSKFLEPVTY